MLNSEEELLSSSCRREVSVEVWDGGDNGKAEARMRQN